MARFILGAGITMAVFLLEAACGPGAEDAAVAALDWRVAAQQERLVVAERRLAEGDVRLQALEERLAESDARLRALEAQCAAGPVTQLLHLPDGRVVVLLDEESAIRCAKSNLEAIVTAQRAYDAAFDEYALDFQRLGWAPAETGDCTTHVAFRLPPFSPELVPLRSEPAAPEAVAVITRGEGLGRVFAVDGPGRVFELPRLSEQAVGELVRGGAWVGAVP